MMTVEIEDIEVKIRWLPEYVLFPSVSIVEVSGLTLKF